MFDGNQVLRFEKYKSSDLGGLGVELEDRKIIVKSLKSILFRRNYGNSSGKNQKFFHSGPYRPR